MMGREREGAVVFFDGECGLCDAFVQQLLQRDRLHHLQFAALQGDTAFSTFGPQSTNSDEWSIKLVNQHGRYERSDAALRAIAALGGAYTASLTLLIIPAFVRDWVYRGIATHRYRWFGKLDSCMIPSPALKERFLP